MASEPAERDGRDDAFPFDEGDTVLVRVRENGETGNIVAKFTAECAEIPSRPRLLPTIARFEVPWGMCTSPITLRPHEAEYEVVDGGE